MSKTKLLLLYTLLFLFFANITLTAQEIIFDHTYGFADYSAGKSIVQLPDSGYAFLASTGFAEGNSQLLFVRLDKNGKPLHFRQTADATKLYEGSLMHIAANGEYLITGTVRDGSKPYSPFCMRTDTSFNILWNSIIQTNDWAFGKFLAELPDGSIAVVGETYDTDSTGADALYLRFASDGSLMSSSSSNLPGNDGYTSVELIDSALLLVAGYRKNAEVNDTVPFFAYLDYDGNEVFLRKFGEYKSQAVAMQATHDINNNIICVGNTAMYDTTGHTDYFMCVFTDFGKYLDEVFVELPLWAGADDTYKSIGISGSGHFFIGGTCEGNNYLQPTILIHKFDSNYGWTNGVARAGEQYDKSDVLEQLIATSDGGCIAIGTSTDLGTHISDIFVCKMGPELTLISPVQHFLPIHENSSVSGISVFPNPANVSTQISWENAPQGKSTIVILDLNGRALFNYEHDFSTSPLYTLPLNSISDGCYFLKIQNKTSQLIKKIIKTH